eukprot:gene13291-15706_t
MKELCEHLQKEGCHIGALSNACGAYVVAVLAANGVSDVFHPQAAGMHSIGVTWGSHERASCESAFDELVDDVQALLEAVSARTSSAQ